MKSYYLHQNSETKGPYTKSQISQLLAQGIVTNDANACEVGGSKWFSVAVLFADTQTVSDNKIAQPINLNIGGSNVKTLYCSQCTTATPHITHDPNHLLHVIITIITGGAWLIVWLLLTASADSPKCTVCSRNGQASGAKTAAGCGCLIILAIAAIIFASISYGGSK